MKKLTALLILTLLLLSINTVKAQEKTEVYYFWQVGCSHCATLEPYMIQFEKDYNINLHSYEVRYNQTNSELFIKMAQEHGIDLNHLGTPTTFIGNKTIIGADYEAIENELINCQNPEYSQQNNTCTQPVEQTKITGYAVLSAAIADSINPCAFAVLTFLLVYLMNLSGRKRILKVGLTYTGVVFLVYLFSGLGLLSIIQISGLTKIVYIFAAIIAMIAGLINIKDFFWYGKGITLAIPESKKETIKRLVKKASVPSAILLGIIVSLVELPCTGGVYLAILSLLAKNATKMQALIFLIIYNIIFILPLLAIIWLVYFGLDPKIFEKWRLGNRKWLRLVMGLVMVIIAVIMFLTI